MRDCFNIIRSGYWLKKFRYSRGKNGYYHIIENYTAEKEKGRNLLIQVIFEGHFTPRLRDDKKLMGLIIGVLTGKSLAGKYDTIGFM